MIIQTNFIPLQANSLFPSIVPAPTTSDHKVASFIQNKKPHTLLSTIYEEPIEEPIKKSKNNSSNLTATVISTKKPQKKTSEGRENTLISSSKVQSLIRKPIHGSNIRLSPVSYNSQSNISLITQGTSCFPKKNLSISDLIDER